MYGMRLHAVHQSVIDDWPTSQLAAASLASSITTPRPALTVGLAVALLGDQIEIRQIVALAAMVACIYGLPLASLRKARAAEAAEMSPAMLDIRLRRGRGIRNDGWTALEQFGK